MKTEVQRCSVTCLKSDSESVVLWTSAYNSEFHRLHCAEFTQGALNC